MAYLKVGGYPVSGGEKRMRAEAPGGNETHRKKARKPVIKRYLPLLGEIAGHWSKYGVEASNVNGWMRELG